MLYDWSDKKILIVEDTYLNFQLLEVILESSGVHVSHAKNSSDFFRLIDNKYDIILMDISLGERLTGIDLLRHMRMNNNYTPVIIQTAYSRDYIIDDDIKYEGFVEKPINFPFLLEMIDNIFKKNN